MQQKKIKKKDTETKYDPKLEFNENSILHNFTQKYLSTNTLEIEK